MTRQKKVSESHGKAFRTRTMARRGALKQFERIVQATAVLTWREGYRRHVESLDKEHADRFLESIDDSYPPDEELRRKLEYDRHHYEAFWDCRLSSMNLFDEGYGWKPECKGLVIGKEGTEPILLESGTVEMAMLLTEDLVGFRFADVARFRTEVNCCFDLNQQEISELAPALHDQVVSRLVGILSGEHLSNLVSIITQNMEFPEFKNTGVMEKVVRVLNDERRDDSIYRLGDYCITRVSPIYRINKALREHGGEGGKSVGDQLIKYMQAKTSRLQETLDSLRGEKQ